MVHLYGPLIGHWCRKYQLTTEDTADILQVVFLSVARNITGFQPGQRTAGHTDSDDSTTKGSRQIVTGGSFRAWLWVITRSRILDLLKKKRCDHPKGGSSMMWQLQQLVDPIEDDPADESELQKLVHRALEQIRTHFREATWQAFWETTMENRDTNEVAQQLGMRPASVRQARSRVMRQLRKQLGDCL